MVLKYDVVQKIIILKALFNYLYITPITCLSQNNKKILKTDKLKWFQNEGFSVKKTYIGSKLFITQFCRYIIYFKMFLTLPNGLFGVFKKIAFVLSENFLVSSSGSSFQSALDMTDPDLVWIK